MEGVVHYVEPIKNVPCGNIVGLVGVKRKGRGEGGVGGGERGREEG